MAAVATVAATYLYFLIFAQFGFLRALTGALGDAAAVVRPVMAIMGAAGLAGSVLAARGFTERRSRAWLAAGFGSCALAAAGSLAVHTLIGFAAVALLTGLGAGITTVTLAGLLQPATGGRRLGVIIGVGTGLAYGISNLPGIFDAAPSLQAGIAIMTAIAGAGTGGMLAPKFPATRPVAGDYSKTGVAAWVAIFLALVCLDSALFAFIQRTAELKQSLWMGSGRSWLIAVVHFGSAAIAGAALDRGWVGRTTALAAAALVGAAFWVLAGRPGAAAAGLVYITSVSIYSTALVFYPARSARPKLAALLYAVAGWGGSALGISLAEGRMDLPRALLLIIAVLLVISFTGRYFASRRGRAMNENNGA